MNRVVGCRTLDDLERARRVGSPAERDGREIQLVCSNCFVVHGKAEQMVAVNGVIYCFREALKVVRRGGTEITEEELLAKLSCHRSVGPFRLACYGPEKSP
jgi:hypothetical protein